MKKLFFLSIKSISRHLGMSILIFLQILSIGIGTNVLVASHNHQTELIAPFAEVLSQYGYYMDLRAETLDGTLLLDALEGEWEVSCIRQYHATVSQDGQAIGAKILVYEDSFWNACSPMLSKGHFYRSENEKNAPWCLATPNLTQEMLTKTGIFNRLQIVGWTGDLCYIPSMSQWNRNGGLDENFYIRFNLEQSAEAYILMPQTQWEQLNIGTDALENSSQGIVVCKQALTEQEIQANEKLLVQSGSPAIPLSTLHDRAETALQQNTRRFLPLLLAEVMITVFGIVCATAIHALKDRPITAIYSLCGMQRKQGVLIALCNSMLLVGMSCLWLLIVYGSTKLFGFHALYGLRFRLNNLTITIILMILMMSSSMFAELAVNRSKHPAAMLRRTT